MPVPAETGFIELKGWCPFKFEKNISGLMATNELLIDTTFDLP
jgi:hypothetical protein